MGKKDIRDTKSYNNFMAKFNQHIILDNNGVKQSLIPPPNNWPKIKTDMTTKNSRNVGIIPNKKHLLF